MISLGHFSNYIMEYRGILLHILGEYSCNNIVKGFLSLDLAHVAGDKRSL